ncbi:MAG TPA: acyltransferase [Candidatus Acidoferrales bacterium]|nr:acyltransferase [Candidatus Acidoferrales bacterium]
MAIALRGAPLLRSIKLHSIDALLFVANHVVAHLPSHRLRLGFYRTWMGMRIGEGSAILMGARIDTRRGFSMGRHSVINQRCRLDSRGDLEIGDNVSISADVCILTADHDLQSPEFAFRARPVRIADYVFIGTGTTILPGVDLGTGSAVAAGAIVTKDVPEYTIVAGVPARPVGSRTRDLTYTLSYRRPFH